jgi:hypothetical protein
MPEDRKYVRVYFSIIDDPKFAEIYRHEATVGTWLKLLMTADAVWPASCDLPRWVKPGPLTLLTQAGIVDLLPDHRYRIHGLDAERTRRATAAAVGGHASGRSRSVEQSLNERSQSLNERSRDERTESNLAKQSRAETSKAEQNAPASTERYDPFDEPEREALTWLSRHGCDVRPGNGYHQRLVVAVEHHGVNALIGMMDRLAAAGTKAGDTKGFLFGAIDTLDARSRPKLAEIEAEDRAGNSSAARQRRIDRTRAETAAMRSAIEGNDVA